MAYTVIATWVANKGEEDACREILKVMTPLTRAEPGCREYVVLAERNAPGTWVLYEVYDDEAAFQAHRESEHFIKHVQNDAAKRLEQRFAKFYEPLD
jgi:autoinducer 2-degrading protein